MKMTFRQFLASQSLRVWKIGDTWAIIKANDKVLKSKEGKRYEGYARALDAETDLENDLVKAGVLTPAK
jgi:hypothetical protein